MSATYASIASSESSSLVGHTVSRLRTLVLGCGFGSTVTRTPVTSILACAALRTASSTFLHCCSAQAMTWLPMASSLVQERSLPIASLLSLA